MSGKERKEFDGFLDHLKMNGSLKRLGKLFQTKENGYIYDLGTGKVLSCGADEYKVLNSIIENDGLKGLDSLQLSEETIVDCLRTLKTVIEEEKLLQAPPLTEFSSLHGEFHKIQEQIEQNLQQITLELTEKCNLRCKYCIYTEDNETHRGFDTHDMTWDTAKKAIDYGIEHAGERLAITFYGGEPLLQFDLLKQCVEYVKTIAGNKKITHSMTTNMVLMTKEIAEYLASLECFTVVCSLDGPEEVHDANRLTVNGQGSFEKAIRGLRYLVDAYGDRAATYLSLSMVMTLPAAEDKFKKIQDFFDSLEWFPDKMVKNISYVSSSSHRIERLTKQTKQNEDFSKVEFVNPIADWTQENVVFGDNIESQKVFTSSFMQSAYLRIHKRMIVDDPVGCYNLCGCCVPASRRLYITATGNFSLCEKIGNAPYIGNIDDGVSIDSIKKHYIDDYMTEAKKLCSECWAVRFCGNCYVDSYDADGFRPEFKKDLCGSALYGTEKALVSYHEMLERHPEKLEYLNDIVLS